MIQNGLRTSESCFRAILTPLSILVKIFFDFKMTYLKLFFASELQIGLKMAIYDGFYTIQVAILGVPVRPCAWEDEEHDDIKLFT